ncbi:MAG: hypothetical protein IPG82_10990 [Saprospiraceae bacterium]|nr:hypothetical protein [Saprospiraceae bacterium]
MTYSTVVTAGDGGASINGSNFLQITNDNSGAANALGMTFITGPLSTYASPFINTLASNDGVIEWTFNMRYGRTTAPSGFDGGNYGIAAVLAASSSDLTTANGYAIVYGGTETTKRYKLVSFNNGLDLNSNITDIISNTSSAPANFNNYVSLRVRYNPSTNEWSMYFRDDGSSGWGDPSAGVSNQVGSTIVNSTFTNTVLSAFGFLWNYNTLAAQVAQFDNFKVLAFGKYAIAGAYTYTVPPGVTCIQVEAWGAGGGGGSGTGDRKGGGGGGAYARSLLTVVPGTNYVVKVGAGGAIGVAGDSSKFGTLVIALGGGSNTGSTGGTGGSTINSVGQVKQSGGNGGTGPNNGGGGGGGQAGCSAGSGTNGANSLNNIDNGDPGGLGGGQPGNSGVCGTVGSGGNGGNESGTVPDSAQIGNSPGGGGGGRGDDDNQFSAAGADGAVIITIPTFISPAKPSVSASPNPFCTGESVQLLISGNINGGEYWAIYTGSCGGTLIGTTTTDMFNLGVPGGSTTYYVRGEGNCVSAGPCDTIQVIYDNSSANCLPDCVSPVMPLDGSTGVSTYGVLEWYPSIHATSYKLFFGTNPGATNIVNGMNVGNVLSYDPPGTQSVNTTYYWRVIPTNSFGDAIGCDTFSFTTWDQACENFTHPTYCTTCAGCPVVIAPNPDLTGSCANLKIALVLDESGSISASEADSVKAATNAFVRSLACTGVKLAVIEFRGDARYVLKESVLNGGYRVIDDSLVAAIENYTSNGPYNHPLLAYTGATPAGYTPGTGGAGGTNYMAPLLAVDSLKERPDLLLFITDGMPTEVYTSNFVYSNSSTTACTATGNPAKVANKLKCEGTHIFAYGIAEATPGPLQDISDTTLFDELPGQSIANTDYVISNFTQLLVGLTDFVTQLCPLYTSTNSQDVCPGSSNGSITISVPPIYIPFDYAYFDQFGAVPLGTGTNVMTSLFSINGLPPGVYRVEIKIKLAPTCTRTETRIVSIVPGAVNVDATITAITNPTCTNMNSGSATLNISAGESPFMITLKKASEIQPGYPIMNWAPTTFIAGSLMAGAYSIEVKDANLCNTDTSFFTIFSADTVKPVITCPSNITVYKDINCIADTSTVKTGQATATDNFSTVTTFNYIDSRTNGTCPYNYTINRTWTATDSCGNISLPCSQVITVLDTIKPVISCPGGNHRV